LGKKGGQGIESSLFLPRLRGGKDGGAVRGGDQSSVEGARVHGREGRYEFVETGRSLISVGYWVVLRVEAKKGGPGKGKGHT